MRCNSAMLPAQFTGSRPLRYREEGLGTKDNERVSSKAVVSMCKPRIGASLPRFLTNCRGVYLGYIVKFADDT